jgi:hypothetical protein
MSDLKDRLIRLGSQNPELREHIRPVLDKIALSGGMSHRDMLEELNDYIFEEVRNVVPNGMKVEKGDGRGTSMFHVAVQHREYTDELIFIGHDGEIGDMVYMAVDDRYWSDEVDRIIPEKVRGQEFVPALNEDGAHDAANSYRLTELKIAADELIRKHVVPTMNEIKDRFIKLGSDRPNLRPVLNHIEKTSAGRPPTDGLVNEVPSLSDGSLGGEKREVLYDLKQEHDHEYMMNTSQYQVMIYDKSGDDFVGRVEVKSDKAYIEPGNDSLMRTLEDMGYRVNVLD